MTTRPWSVVRRAEAVGVVAGSVALVGSWGLAAAADAVPGWEEAAFEAVNRLPDALWPVVWGPMQLGSLVGSLVVVGATAVVGRNARLTAAAFVASQVAFWSAKGIKHVVGRGRPADLLATVELRERATGLGFVSGHAAVACALAAVLAPSLPRAWAGVAVAAAAVVAAGRVYAGAHLPLDVIGGAGFGVLCGTLARWAFGLGGEGLPARPGVTAGQM